MIGARGTKRELLLRLWSPPRFVALRMEYMTGGRRYREYTPYVSADGLAWTKPPKGDGWRSPGVLADRSTFFPVQKSKFRAATPSTRRLVDYPTAHLLPDVAHRIIDAEGVRRVLVDRRDADIAVLREVLVGKGPLPAVHSFMNIMIRVAPGEGLVLEHLQDLADLIKVRLTYVLV